MSADPGKEKCAACNAGADSETKIWGVALCYSCAVAWDQEAPSQVEAEKKYPDDAQRHAAFREFTVKWATKRRAVAA